MRLVELETEFKIPKKTVKAYKLFKVKNGKLYPLYVNATKEVPLGEWLPAEIGPEAKDGKVKSSLGPLAFRPGWHAGDLPIATHIGGKSGGWGQKKPDYRPDDQVWAEVEFGDDVDWQTEANKRASKTKAGKIVPRTAHITDVVPHGGYYKYKTNANMTGSWMIGGEMLVKRILSDEEVKKINDAAGTADLPRLHELQARQSDDEVQDKEIDQPEVEPDMDDQEEEQPTKEGVSIRPQDLRLY